MTARIFLAIVLAIPAVAADTAKVPADFHQAGAGTNADTTVAKWWYQLHDDELTSLIDRAVNANLDLKIAASRVLEARAARRVSNAALQPTVGVSASMERFRGGLTQGLPAPIESNVYQTGFDASWELDFFGGHRHAVEAATSDIAAVEQVRRDVLVSLLAEVGRNYAELRGYQLRLRIARDNIALQEDSLHLARVRADAGLGTQLDVERQTAQLESTRSAVPSLEVEEARTIHRLGVLLGEEPGKLLSELTPAASLPLTPLVVPVGLPSELLQRRPDIREAQARIGAETARVGVAHADLFPKILLTGAAGREGTSRSGLTLGAGNLFSFGPAITLPIFSGGKIRANIAAQKERLNQALTEYQSTVLRSLEETENSLVAYSREKERRDILVSAVESSRQAARLANELYARGLSDFLAVLDAQRQQLGAEDDLARSNTAVVTDLVALYKALGGGWEGL